VTSESDNAASPPPAPQPAPPAPADDLARSFQASKSALRDFTVHSAKLLRFALSRLTASARGAAGSLRGHVGAHTGRLRTRLSTPGFAAFRARMKSLLPGRRLRRIPALLSLLLAAVVIPLGVMLYLLAAVPVNGGISADSQGAMTLEAANGDLFAARGVLKGQQLMRDEIPEHLLAAIIAIEDRRFYDHHGVDLRGMFRAAWRNTAAGGVREGGSTITQQLARLLYLSPDRSIKRKLQEMLLALWLESKLSKDEILTKYLNTAFFGAGAYGIDAAARRYFGKPPKELSLGEAAMLAGLVRAPSQLAPTRNFGGAKERADLVLQAMVESGKVSAEAAEAARAQNITLRTPPDTPPGSNFFVDMVAGDFRKLLGAPSGDVRLQTTLDLELQNLAQGVIERRLDAEGGKRRVSQAALVALRRDGAIVAMVGGRDYEASQFNRAVQARRQAGSLFKVFVYDAALQRGYNPATTVVDRPVRIADWEPENYSGGHRGAMSARNAFANSVNTVAAQLADEVGIPAVIESAKRLGVQSPLPAVPSLALGAAEVTLLEMTKAFAAIGFGLQSLEPYAVRGIVGPNQQTLYTKGKTASEVAGAAVATRAMMLDLMQAVVETGTGKAARVNGVPVAGKTGTTQEYRDAWFIGFTPELAVGVWVGNDDNAPMANVTGGDMPARIWKEFVEQAIKRQARSTTVARAPASQTAETGERVRGRADVIDTATLEINDRPIPLFGVEPNRDVRALRALARYLRRRDVVCASADAGSYRCAASGQDIAEAVLAAGVARASANASPELLAVEEMARAQRVGMWRR
jgi:penicillin-binding protein 1A